MLEKKLHTLTILVYQRDQVYSQVNELLHAHAPAIMLRVGYPVKEKNAAIIFLVMEMTTDEVGALSGRLGQLSGVKVKAATLSF